MSTRRKPKKLLWKERLRRIRKKEMRTCIVILSMQHGKRQGVTKMVNKTEMNEIQRIHGLYDF